MRDASVPMGRRQGRTRLRAAVPIDPAASDAALFLYDTGGDPIASLIAIHSAACSIAHVLRRHRRAEALLASDGFALATVDRRRRHGAFAVYLRGTPALVRASMRRWARVAPRTAIRAWAVSRRDARAFAPLAVVRDGFCWVERGSDARIAATLRDACLPLGEVPAAELRALASEA